MTELTEAQPKQNKEFPLLGKNRNLTLFEHRFIGGSEDVNGKWYDANVLVEDIRNNNGMIPDEYFQPIAIMRGEEVPENVNNIRQNYYLRGALGFLGESWINAYENGYDTVIKLPAFDPEAGIAPKKWILFLVDKEENVSVDRKILEQLVPSGHLKDLLQLDIKEDGIHISVTTLPKHDI